MTLSVGMALAVVLGAEPVSPLLTYGPLGIMVAAFMLGMIYSKSTVDRLIVERDRADDRSDRLIAEVTTRVVPVLERAIESMHAKDARDAKIESVLTDVRRLLESR